MDKSEAHARETVADVDEFVEEDDTYRRGEVQHYADSDSFW